MEKKNGGTVSPVDVLFSMGAGLISIGLGLLTCWAVAMIALGVFSLAAAWMSDAPQGEDGEGQA